MNPSINPAKADSDSEQFFGFPSDYASSFTSERQSVTGICPMKFRAIALLLIASCLRALGFEKAYWAWQRNEPPSAREIEELRGQGVRSIYWQIGELVEDRAA